MTELTVSKDECPENTYEKGKLYLSKKDGSTIWQCLGYYTCFWESDLPDIYSPPRYIVFFRSIFDGQLDLAYPLPIGEESEDYSILSDQQGDLPVFTVQEMSNMMQQHMDDHSGTASGRIYVDKMREVV